MRNAPDYRADLGGKFQPYDEGGQQKAPRYYCPKRLPSRGGFTTRTRGKQKAGTQASKRAQPATRDEKVHKGIHGIQGKRQIEGRHRLSIQRRSSTPLIMKFRPPPCSGALFCACWQRPFVTPKERIINVPIPTPSPSAPPAPIVASLAHFRVREPQVAKFRHSALSRLRYEPLSRSAKEHGGKS
ncbi:hypothetical protein cyc_05653 [Cyclospora cayetanensis]|uniref:Uncharacterized protein n=1 Tax=Cyclospora cayetanensis TaxID=88456 RepID=A0A1D3D4W1_9EIME|nr:hypothetical protein cyc_05653 [Cyclospora cayetanensis]